VVDALRLCPPLPLTRAAFHALDEKSRNTAKQVPFFVPACFKASPSKRVYEQATHCNLIFLDIDPEKEHRNGKWVETGRYPAAPFIANPNLLHQALAGFNWAAHLTASSTPEKPRMRIVVDAEKIPLALYPRAAMAVAALLGIPAITKESKVAVQPMFLPVLFTDSTDEDHPLIEHSIDGRTFTPADVGEELFPELDKPAGTNGTHPPASLEALDFLRAPVPEITLAAAKEALHAIDPDCSRDEWLAHAAALKHNYCPQREEEAFTVFDEWSQGGEKYGGEKETRALWKSLRQTPNHRAPVTIRSLLKAATSAGWDDRKAKEQCFSKVSQWLDVVENVSDLVDRGIQKIIATPLLSAVQEGVLINQLCANARKRFMLTVSVSDIRKDIARIKLEAKEADKPPVEKTREPGWTKSVCYIANAQDFYRHRTGERYRAESFNAIYARHLLPTEEGLKDAGITPTPAALAKPMVPPVDYALNHIKIPTVYDYAYDPSQPTEQFFVNRGRRYVNTYTATYPELDYDCMPAARELFEGHLSRLVAEPDYRQTLTDFLAYMVQFPGRKIRWAVMVQSVDGAGKTFLAEAMKAVLGTEHVMLIDGPAIKSGYNEWSFGHQLVVLEEVRVAGTNRHEIMNALKPLITNDEVTITERYRNSRKTPNISNYILFSNHHDALALTPGDRRYFVIKSPLQTKEQVKALGDNYFPPLYAMLRDFPGALRAYFMDWQISPAFSADGHAPRTRYVQELINDSANDLAASVRRLLLEGDYPLIQYDVVSTKVLTDVIQLEDTLRFTPQQLAHVLRDEGLHQAGRHTIGTERHYLWSRPSIGAAEAVATALDRVETGAKNLCMELLFS
jgi:hypothetical protein